MILNMDKIEKDVKKTKKLICPMMIILQILVQKR